MAVLQEKDSWGLPPRIKKKGRKQVVLPALKIELMDLIISWCASLLQDPTQ
jgi:hypothetical protein